MKKMYKVLVKPVFDFLAAFIGLLLISPLFVVVLIALSIENNGNPFFYQLRSGRKGAIFTIIKFKTMTDKKDLKGKLLPDSDRITKIGDFCRKFSLDELPQLINVLKGDMSIIGPRPLLIQYLPLYNERQFRRHEVLPGITGWAQINGRNTISWEQKFELDVFYVDHQSFFLDLKILLKTIDKVISRSDINSSENLNMPEFEGTKK